MVDFNQAETMTTAPRVVIQFMILEKYNYVLEAFESYDRADFKGTSTNTYEVQCRLRTLYRLLRGAIKKEQTPEFLTLQDNKILSKDYLQLMEVLDFLTDWLHSKKLIDIFTAKKYDTTDMEAENEIHGI